MDFVHLLSQESVAYGVTITSQVLSQSQLYFDLLSRWRPVVNLTAVDDPRDLARFHFLESMYGARYMENGPALHYDLGSGAGFPAISLKLMCPALYSVLFESRQRRSAFLKELIRALYLKDSLVQTERIEPRLVEHWPVLQYITLRAIQLSDEVFQSMIPRLSVGGRLLIWHSMDYPPLHFLRQSSYLHHLASDSLPHSSNRFLSVFERRVPL